MTWSGSQSELASAVFTGKHGFHHHETVTIATQSAHSATAVVTRFTADEIAAAGRTATGENVIAAKDLKVRVKKDSTITNLTNADKITRGGVNYRVLSVVQDPPLNPYEFVCHCRY